MADYFLGFWTIKMPMLWEFLLRGGAGFHLWFLSSLMQGLLLLILLRPLGWPVVLSVALMMYAADLAIGTYSAVSPFGLEWNSRWGPAVGFLFVSIGNFLFEKNIVLGLKTSLAGFALFALLNIGELRLIQKMGYPTVWGTPDIRVSTVFYGVAAFFLVQALARRLDDSGNVWVTRVGALGRLSLGIYLVHVLVYETLQYFGLFDRPPLILAMTTIAISTAVAYLGVKSPLRRLFI